ncbi:hypothetical protein [uncultured phage cr77_1]|uniref:Uncharacterized protein n=1 Tax=uncultured phage cr77_1 TaxID=2986410 RepID=A0AAE7RVV0_9CAUD|nr:hypothetical protein M1M50_gp033 [uncultured phage cr77_1]QWM89777.1 hypothetical protein [uncultured phage cr77_1]
MKWSDLSFKEKKQIYDSIKAQNPDTTYLDIKSQFDSIPEYEDGKNRSRWLSDKAYRDSISTLQNSQRFKISKEFKSPTLEELRDDSSVGGNIGNSDGLFTVLDGLEALKTTPSITSEQIENATDSQYNSRINRLEPLKQYAKVGSIIGQAALGGGAIVARNAGNAALSSVLQGAGALWDGVEAIQAVNDGDFKSVIQNVVPIGAAGVASLKYAPKFKYTNNLVIDAAENIGPIWDLSVNPIIESTKDGKAPAYEDGGKKIMPPKELGLTPGTPEYYKRQQQISGKASTVQPEAYITPAGYVKDAINFVEDLSNGDYTGAAVDAALNIIPWGVGKTLKKFKSKVGRLIEGTDEYATSSYAEPFTPTITKPIKAKRTPSGERNYNPAKPPKDIEAQAAMLQDTWYREAVNKNQYSNEILRSVDQALYPDEDTRKLVREIDKAYNTNYEKAYSDIAYKEITGRKDYVSYGSMGDNIYGKANMKNIQDGFTSSNVDDYSIVLDPSTYMPGTANHELGYMADGIAGSIKYEAEPGVDYITNPYLRYLADPDNTYTTKELRDAGFHSAAKNKRYLLNPTESKSHMLTLKRALKDSNKISKWSDPVDENMILDYFRSGRANGAVRNQYDLYIDKQRYIDRLNRLVPMEWLLPTIGLGGAEFLREKQNNKSN